MSSHCIVITNKSAKHLAIVIKSNCTYPKDESFSMRSHKSSFSVCVACPSANMKTKTLVMECIHQI